MKRIVKQDIQIVNTRFASNISVKNSVLILFLIFESNENHRIGKTIGTPFKLKTSRYVS